MHKIIWAFVCACFVLKTHAQVSMKNNYTDLWKKIETDKSKGLPQSAEKTILLVINKAKFEKNTEQYIKGMCVLRSVQSSRDENAILNHITFFEKELATAPTIAQPIMHCLLASLYWNYYEENRWKILDRTTTQETTFSTSNIESWSAQQIYNQVLQHNSQAISLARPLQSIPIQSFRELIQQENKSELIRPTVYDVILHDAIDQFSNHEIEITKPAYTFEIQDTLAFLPAAAFVQHQFQTNDSSDYKFQVIKLYQQLINFHLTDEKPDALIDVDLHRLNYIYDHAIIPNKQKHYEDALQQILIAYPKHPLAAMAEIKRIELAMGNTDYLHVNPRHQHMQSKQIDLIAIKNRLEKISATFPGSEAASRAAGILQQIHMVELQIQTEKVVLPDMPSLARIQIKNINTLYVKIVALTPDEVRNRTFDYNNDYQYIIKKPSVTQYAINLPLAQDYHVYTTEIKINALPIGQYGVILSDSKEISTQTHYAVSILTVSNLAYFELQDQSATGMDIYIVDRKNGKPLPGIQCRTWYSKYDYNKQQSILYEGKLYVSDKSGNIHVGDKTTQSFSYELMNGKDHLFLGDQMNVYDQSNPEPNLYRTFIFTDRSIYRPGQTIHCKGIATQLNQHHQSSSKVRANIPVTVIFKDANYQEISRQELTTNDYGSFYTTFKAPEGLLNGQFHISADYGEVPIQIEAYKRPTFEVTFDTLQQNYRLGDNIHIQGRAMAYAGQAIDRAKVSYRVVRKAVFPYLWCYYRWGQPASAAIELAHGSLETGSDGKFSFTFNALPDASIQKETMPVFTYEIWADVTDINGESHSGYTSTNISYQSLTLQIDAPAMMTGQTPETIAIHTKNMQSVFTSAKVSIRCTQLQSPLRMLRSRLWEKVDTMIISAADFAKDFPLDEYNNENDYTTWDKKKVVWEQTFTTQINSSITLPQSLENGWYVLEASTTDKDGQTIIDKQYIRIYQDILPEALPNESYLVTRIRKPIEPPANHTIYLSTPFSMVNVLWYTCKAGAEKSSTQWIQVNKTHTQTYPISDADRGGFYVGGCYVQNNRLYSFTEQIEVPWSNKDLHVRLETFRDKMLPGSAQQWRISISGDKKDKVQAELLATMYDASLDAFIPHKFESMPVFTSAANRIYISGRNNFVTDYARVFYFGDYGYVPPFEKSYPSLHWWGINQSHLYNRLYESNIKFAPAMSKSIMQDKRNADDMEVPAAAPVKVNADGGMNGETDKQQTVNKTNTSIQQNQSPVLRKNFSETAFFFPQLYTNANGDIILQFTAPEALTRWKLLAFAHTPSLQTGQLSAYTATQKEVMIIPNTPRFLRTTDKLTYTAKVTNLSDQPLQAIAQLHIIDAITEKNVDTAYKLLQCQQKINLLKGESKVVQWNIEVPNNFINPVHLQTFVEATHEQDTYRDGESNTVPVLTNAVLVTETLPLPVHVNSTKQFTLSNLLLSAQSNSLRHYQMQVEYTANPVWYAIQALSYLTDYPYECAEQTFNRYYANAIAAHLVQANPNIVKIFQQWQIKDTQALISSLEKNTAFKSALLEETPWVAAAKSESEQIQMIKQLFEFNRMREELNKAILALEKLQMPDGGFTWFPGMPANTYITQYIITGIGHLQYMGITHPVQNEHIQSMLQKALPYLDKNMQHRFTYIINEKQEKNYQIEYEMIQYLYMRSYFTSYPIAPSYQKAFSFFKDKAASQWLQNNRMAQGMTAIALNRFQQPTVAKDIIRSLKEHAIINEELGMYWKENIAGYWWYEAPIETQCILIEAFQEINENTADVDRMKIWLLKHKQSHHWPTTKATADAIYALLMKGSDWLSNNPEVTIQIGDKTINSNHISTEAGTGFFTQHFDANEIKANMGHITVQVKGNKQIATTWGAVYWQYFEDMHKIKAQHTPLQISKQLFVQNATDRGVVLTPINEQRPMKVGDRVVVRIEVRCDRNMEFVHIKDLRASCFEPIQVLSQYQFKSGLGYYESTKDISTNYFIQYLPKGMYVFEYPVWVTHVGDFEQGMAQIQSMYAPEFSSHSEGNRIHVIK